MPARRSLCFSRQPCFLPSGSECKIGQTIMLLQAIFLASLLIMLYSKEELLLID